MALSTFQLQKDTLADWVGTTTTSPRWSDATRGILINRAIRYICARYDLRYNEASVVINLIASTPSYVIPTDYSRPFFAWYLDPTTFKQKTLPFLTYDAFTALYPDPTATSLPGNFSVYGTSLFVGKTPNQPLTMNLTYYNIPAELVNPTDSNALLIGCWEAVFDRALVEASEYLVDDDRMDLWLRKWKETEFRLVSEHTRSRSNALIPQSIEPH